MPLACNLTDRANKGPAIVPPATADDQRSRMTARSLPGHAAYRANGGICLSGLFWLPSAFLVSVGSKQKTDSPPDEQLSGPAGTRLFSTGVLINGRRQSTLTRPFFLAILHQHP